MHFSTTVEELVEEVSKYENLFLRYVYIEHKPKVVFAGFDLFYTKKRAKKNSVSKNVQEIKEKIEQMDKFFCGEKKARSLHCEVKIRNRKRYDFPMLFKKEFYDESSKRKSD